MSGRLDPRPLLRGLRDGLKRRDFDEPAPTDWPTVIVLVGVPLGVGAVLVALRFELSHADQLLAGSALLAGALLGAFSLIAGWRTVILQRSRKIDDVDVRALNEAAAHILAALIASIAATVVVVVLTNMDLVCAAGWVHRIAQALSGLAAALFSYVVISLLIVTNLLWDAYTKEQEESQRETLPDFNPGNSA